jgi:hypothetical protein
LRSRTAFLVCNVAVVSASVLVGAGVLRVPAAIGVSLALYALILVPGIAAGNLLFGSPSDPLEAICRTFCIGIVFVSSVVCAGFLPGVTYRIISPLAASLVCLVALIDRMRSAKREPYVASGVDERGPVLSGRFGGLAFLVAALCFGLCFTFFYGSGDVALNTDSLDHISYIRRSIESGRLFPVDSFYGGGDGASFDVRKGLWHPVLSLWAYQSHVAPDLLWRLLPSFLSFFALSSFLFFGIELLGSGGYAVLGLAFMLLFYGGEGVRWFTKIGFSRNIMQVLFWVNAAFLLRYYRLKDTKYLAAVFLVSATACAFHVVYALLVGALLLGFVCYGVLAKRGSLGSGAMWRSLLVVAAALSLPLAARAHAFGAVLNHIHTHRQGMLILSRRLAIVDPAELAMREGLVFFYALVLVPFYFLVAPRPRRGLVFALTIVPALIVCNPLIAPLIEYRIGYLHYRILDAAPLMFYCALIVGGLVRVLFGGGPLFRGRALGRRAAALIGIAVFLYYPARAAVRQFRDSVATIASRSGGTPARYRSFMMVLQRRLPDHSVIVSDPLTSYVISGLTDHFVVVTLDQHGSPADPAALERLHAVRDILSPVVPLAESFPWLTRWKADYVLLNMELPPGADFFGTVVTEGLPLTAEKLRSCRRALDETIAEGGFTLFAVRRDSLASRSDWCEVPLVRSLPCEDGEPPTRGIGGAGCGIMLEAVSIGAGEIAAGDTLRCSLCWLAPDTVSFGLPLDVTIRIDTDFPKGRWYRPWYGKQYRRIAERRRGVFYRCTWHMRLLSGFSFPEQWIAGVPVRQDVALAIPRRMAPGRYDLRVKIRRATYLPNRRIADYLSNRDSLQGMRAGTIVVSEARAPLGRGGPMSAFAPSVRRKP